MNTLTPFAQGLYQKFKTDSTLSAAFPAYTYGGTSIPVRFFPGIAMDGCPMPYCTYDLITGMPSQAYALNGPADLDIQFTVTAIGFAAALALADSVRTILDAWGCPVSLSAGQIVSIRRTMEAIPVLSDAEADASSNDVWDVKFSYGFTVE